MPQPKKRSEAHILHVPKGATLKQIYAIIKKNFTADDLAWFCNIDESKMIPADGLLPKLEAVYAAHLRKQKKSTPKKKKP